MTDARRRLRQRLDAGDGPPRLLDELDGEQAGHLLACYERATERQRRGLEASMEAVLSHAPRMLRGRLTRVLFPEGG